MGACLASCVSNAGNAVVMEGPGYGKRFGQYEMTELIGSGSQSQVWKCISYNIEGQFFATKVIKKRSLVKKRLKAQRKTSKRRGRYGKYGKATGHVKREIAIMKRLRHDHVVNLFDVLDDPDNQYLYVVLEFMPGGPLFAGDFSEANPIEKDRARGYFQQLILGLEYLHHHDVFHRDIKPSNLLLSADRKILKISDFGVSEFLHNHNDSHRGLRGTVAFLAPEAFKADGFHAAPVDVWASAVTLYFMLYGVLPFRVRNVESGTDDRGDTKEDAARSPAAASKSEPKSPSTVKPKSERIQRQLTVSEMEALISKCDVSFPHRRYPEAEAMMRLILVAAPEKRASLRDLKLHKWLRVGAWKMKMPKLSDKHLEKISVTHKDIQEAVLSVDNSRTSPRKSSSIASSTTAPASKQANASDRKKKTRRSDIELAERATAGSALEEDEGEGGSTGVE
eukprot:g1152.t1